MIGESSEKDSTQRNKVEPKEGLVQTLLLKAIQCMLQSIQYLKMIQFRNKKRKYITAV